MLKELDQRFDQPFRAEFLSSRLNMSYQYLARLFKSGLGMSPVEYIHRKRIARARRLLLSGQFGTIAEVARAVGFEDPYYI